MTVYWFQTLALRDIISNCPLEFALSHEKSLPQVAVSSSALVPE